MDSLHSAIFWVRLLHGDVEGCREFGCFWLFNPGPMGCKGPLEFIAFWVSSIECPPLHARLIDAIMLCLQQVAVCLSCSAHMVHVLSTKLWLPGGKSMPLNSYNTWGAHRLTLGPLGYDSLFSWCYSLFQAATFQSIFEEQDSKMAGPRGILWNSRADQRTSAEWRPGERANCRNLPAKKFLGHLKL